MMIQISNPSFLSLQPPKRVQLLVLAVLLWTALPLAGTLPVGVMVLFGAVWLLRVLLLQLGIRLPVWLPVLMSVAAGLAVWQQLGTVLGREGGIAVLLLLVLMKSFENKSMRDWQVLLLSMLFLTGASVVLNQSLLTGLWLLSALTLLGWCFALLCGLAWQQSFRYIGRVWLAALPLAAVLFVTVPRMEQPLWRIPQPAQGQAQTGLSDTMSPGSISNLVQSNELVANVTFSDGLIPQRSQMYWRAIIMSDFDGERWRAVGESYTDQAKADAGKTVSYQMILRDQNGVLPVLDYPQADLPKGLSGRLGAVVRADRSSDSVRRVSLQASLADTLPHSLNQGSRAFYTKLPQGNLQTRILAERLRAESATDREFIDKVLAHFRSQGFRYTLQPQPTPGKDGIDGFMFETRNGFCEHYAQSFVVMMRAADIPARIVTGYLGADFNQEGGFWQIRSKDAHAWAEVWLADEQVWLRVDPTAAVSLGRAESGISRALPESDRHLVAADIGAFSRWQEAGRYYWQQWVVNFDHGRQNNLFERLGLGGFNWKTLLMVAPAALLAAVLPLVWWWQRGRRRERDWLNEGFVLLKTVLLGSEDDTLPSVSAADLKRRMRENRWEDETLFALLDEYDFWLYAAGRPSEKEQRRWYKQVAAAAAEYGD